MLWAKEITIGLVKGEQIFKKIRNLEMIPKVYRSPFASFRNSLLKPSMFQ